MQAGEIIDAAVQRSSLNSEDLVPNDQLLVYMSNQERKLFLDAAKINPDFFGSVGVTDSRDDHNDTWNLTIRPGLVAAVTKVEAESIVGVVDGVESGDEINLVSIRQPQVDLAPRAYITNKRIRSYEDELGDDASNFVESLRVWYSRLPSRLQTENQETTLPDEWSDLLIIPLAQQLALRDQRPEEVQILQAEYEQVYNSFVRQLEIFDHGATRSLRAIRASGPSDFGGEG